ncbi:MAG: hypothetical protein VCD00_00015 [Candidatus Hydrogenedentota bacterium]
MDDERIGSEIEKQARELCSQISVAHDLDSEIQEELYTHVEDKLLGYLSGEVPVTEEDALILVREHFGDPLTIKSLLQDVHVEEVTISQARRRTAAVIVTLAWGLVGALLMNAVTVGLHYYRFKTMTAMETARATNSMSELLGIHEYNAFFAVSLFLLLSAITALGPWIFFYRWKQTDERLRERWFYRWSVKRLVLLVIALLAIRMLTPSFAPTWISVDSKVAIIILVGMSLFLYAGQCLAWIWWCDSAPRTKRNTLNTGLLWLVFQIVLTTFIPRTSAQVIGELPSGVETFFQSTGSTVLLYHGHFFDTQFYVSIVWFVPTAEFIFSQGARTLMYMGAAYVVATSGYALNQIRKTRQQRKSFDGLA